MNKKDLESLVWLYFDGEISETELARLRRELAVVRVVREEARSGVRGGRRVGCGHGLVSMAREAASRSPATTAASTRLSEPFTLTRQ